VCNALLERIESAMRSVIVSTTDYDTLELIHTARRLYRSTKGPMGTSERQKLSRRFAEGYRRLLLMTGGKPPPEWIDLQDRLMAYRRELKNLGLKDYQVPALAPEHLDENSVDADSVLSFLQLVYNIAHLLLLLALVGVPWLFLNLPVRLLADAYSESRRKKALARSKVKVRGIDVMLTEKIVFCLVAVPTLWVFYGVLLVCCTDFDGPTIALAILSMPMFAYIGIVVSDHGMVDVQDLRPYFMRLFPSARRRLAVLPLTRKKLQDDLRAFIKSIGMLSRCGRREMPVSRSRLLCNTISHVVISVLEFSHALLLLLLLYPVRPRYGRCILRKGCRLESDRREITQPRCEPCLAGRGKEDRVIFIHYYY